MSPKLKAKWIAALKSGKYKQGGGQLEADGYYCCLGVLCRIAKIPRTEDDFCAYYDGESSFPPEETLDLLGLDEEVANELAAMNDNDIPFDEIAEHIRGAV